jgi:hypothetical protein
MEELITTALSLVDTDEKPSVDTILIALTIKDGLEGIATAIEECNEPFVDIGDELKGIRIATEDMKR